MNAKNHRIGLVGLGKIARDQHLPAIAATPGAELVAIASRNARLEGVANYTTIDDMLAGEPDIDCCVLCQPPQSRVFAARSALLAGKHVFLEKPPGASLSEVEALASLARDQGVTLFASWHSREAAQVDRARDWLAGKELESVTLTWKEDVRVWHPGQSWIWQPGGLGVFDPGINGLSILTKILPSSVWLTDAELLIPANCASPIAAHLQLETTEGAPISVELDFRRTRDEIWEIGVQSSTGSLRLWRGGNRLAIDGTEQPVEEESEYRSLYKHFLDLIANSRSDVDIAPLRLVADCFLKGRIVATEPFIE